MIEQKIKRFVAWGHKLHTHTHSYIHNAFIRAFQHLGYPTLWLDKNDDISGIDFEDSLFLTEGQVCENIPVLPSCYYILHNIAGTKYDNYFNSVPSKHILILQVFTTDVSNRITKKCMAPFVYQEIGGNGLSMPWGTDLLPHEIDENIRQFDTIVPASPPELNFVGMPIQPWDTVQNYCKNHGIIYNQVGGFSNNNVNVNDNITLIKRSIVAPAVQQEWQVEHGYIPCRIFKNISYGKMGMTNNETVYHLFGNNILYSSDINQLMEMGLQFESQSMEYKKEKIVSLMEFVRDHHTYLSRIEAIFYVFNDMNSE